MNAPITTTVNDAEFDGLGRARINAFRNALAARVAERYIKASVNGSRAERRKREAIARMIGSRIRELEAKRLELMKSLEQMREEARVTFKPGWSLLIPLNPEEAEITKRVRAIDKKLRVTRRRAA